MKKKRAIKRNKLGQFIPDIHSWNKGIPTSEDTKEKMHLNHVGMLGRKHTKATIKKLIGNKNALGYKHTPEARKKISETRKRLGLSSGKNNPNWKDGITSESIKERNIQENRQFTKDILKRDNYICVICGSRNKLECDHIMPWGLYPELRQEVKNSRTLCKSCHKDYGADPRKKPIKWAISPISRTNI